MMQRANWLRFVISGSAVSAMLMGLTGCGPKAENTSRLLDQMVDLERLATLPSPSYTTRQFSSYDQASTSAGDATTWFANGDAGQYLRVEEIAGRSEFVMMDTDGPGCVVRIWSANPKGTLRVYLDHAIVPVIEAPMTALLGGEVAGFPQPLAGMRSMGWNLYFPILYAKHCKVTSDEGGFYYHVNYRTYVPGTKVKTFSAGDLKSCADQINRVAQALAAPRKAALAQLVWNTPFDVPLPVGRTDRTVVVAEREDGGAVKGIKLRLKAGNLASAARGVLLKIICDGELTVEAPVGDFFGTAAGVNAYESLPSGAGLGRSPFLWSAWVMPFKQRVEVLATNYTTEHVVIEGEMAVVEREWDDASLYFYGGWRQQQGLPSRPMSDWTHLITVGSGRFVGGGLHVVNPVSAWWGEGDEKIYVDGEAFPSHFGTGSEDYYGYAWCSPQRFTHAYHNQPICDGPRNYGNTYVSRFHVIDDIPFEKSFRFDMENWHSHGETATTRAAMSFWYARPGADRSFFPAITAEQVVLPVVPAFSLPAEPGAMEAEKLSILAQTGEVRPQDLGELVSAGYHLWWTGGQPGDRMSVGFESQAEGPLRVKVCVVKAPDYAMVQFYLNDQKVGGPVDLYNAPMLAREVVDLGELPLNAGQNVLTAEIVGANEKAIKSYMVGLDYLKIE